MSSQIFNGTYELVSWEYRHASGKITYPLGAEAKGMIHYSPDGCMFVHIMASQRKPHASGELFGGDMNEITHSAITHLSYCGGYEVQDKEVIHYVKICSFPNWVGTAQRREWLFKDGKLFLSAHGLKINEENVSAHLVWQRLPRQ